MASARNIRKQTTFGATGREGRFRLMPGKGKVEGKVMSRSELIVLCLWVEQENHVSDKHYCALFIRSISAPYSHCIWSSHGILHRVRARHNDGMEGR